MMVFRKALFFLIIILIFISSAGFVYSEELESYNVTFRIQEDNTVKVRISGCPDINLRLVIPEGSTSIKQTIDDCTTLEYDTPSYIEVYGKRTFFLGNVKVPLNTERLNVKVFLPKGAVIAEPLVSNDDQTDSIFPTPTKIGSDGKYIIIEWQREKIPGGGGLPLAVIYEQKRINTYWYAILLLIVLLSLGTIIFLWKKKPKEIIKEIIKEKEVLINELHLKEDEEIVVNLLRKRNGECEQSTLYIISDFSKAKLSSILKELEERKIVKRVEKGRKKLVYLKEAYLNISEHKKE